LFEEIKCIVIAGRHTEVEVLVEKAIADGANLDDLINSRRFPNDIWYNFNKFINLHISIKS